MTYSKRHLLDFRIKRVLARENRLPVKRTFSFLHLCILLDLIYYLQHHPLTQLLDGFARILRPVPVSIGVGPPLGPSWKTSTNQTRVDTHALNLSPDKFVFFIRPSENMYRGHIKYYILYIYYIIYIILYIFLFYSLGYDAIVYRVCWNENSVECPHLVNLFNQNMNC